MILVYVLTQEVPQRPIHMSDSTRTYERRRQIDGENNIELFLNYVRGGVRSER